MKKTIKIADEARILGVDQAEIRLAHHGLRTKNYGVIGTQRGMYKTTSPADKIRQAEKMLGLADKIREAAEGLINGKQGELTDLELAVWNLLPEKPYVPETYRTTFEPIEVREDGRIE